MPLSAALSPASIATASTGGGASESKPSSGMQGYEVWNRSGLTVYMLDDGGNTIDAIQPYSQRSGTIILPTRNITFAVIKSDPVVPSIGYPSSVWQVLYQLVNVPLPQISTPINTGATQAGTPMQGLANGSVPFGTHPTINVPITSDMTALWIFVDQSQVGATISGIRVSGHQSGMYFRGVSNIRPSGGVVLNGFNVVPLMTPYDTSVDVEFSADTATLNVPYWITARRDSFEVSVDQYGNTIITVQGIGTGTPVVISGNVAENAQNQTSLTLQNGAIGNGNGTTVNTSGLNGAQMVQIDQTGTGSCTVNLQGSYDGVNFFNIGYYQVDGVAAIARAVAALSITAGPFHHAYQLLDYYPQVRAPISATAGTLACTVKLYGVPI